MKVWHTQKEETSVTVDLWIANNGNTFAARQPDLFVEPPKPAEQTAFDMGGE